MSIALAAFLGLIQGLAEFLPISSSGHLNLFQGLFQVNLGNQLLFNILLHLGTLIAVLAVFWREWLAMILHPIKNRTLMLLVIASLPALVGKVLFGDQLDYLETHNILLGVCFLLTSLLLLLTQRASVRNQVAHRETSEVGIMQALVMGVFQAVAMLPGISRSGSSIYGGVATRLDRETAAKFSFMMSMPAIVASFLSEGYDAVKSGTLSQTGDWGAIVVGMAVACVSGFFAIRFMLRIITRISLNWFALYVALLGILVIVLQATNILVDLPDASSTIETTAKAVAALF